MRRWRIPARASKLEQSGTGATYYVDINGSDSNPGTASQPWRTIQKAADTVVAGDTVIVQSGSYPEDVAISASGAASAPILFQAQGTVELASFTLAGDYLQIQGFALKVFDCNNAGFGGERADAIFIQR